MAPEVDETAADVVGNQDPVVSSDELEPVDWMAEFGGDEYALYRAARDIVSEQDFDRFEDARSMLETAADEGVNDANVWLGIMLELESPISDPDAAAEYYSLSLEQGAQLQSLQGPGDINRSGRASWGQDLVTAGRYYGRIYLLENVPDRNLARVDSFFADLSDPELNEVYAQELATLPSAPSLSIWMSTNGFSRGELRSRSTLFALFSESVDVAGTYRFQ